MTLHSAKPGNKAKVSGRRFTTRLFLPALFLYVLLCGYVLYFSTSLFYETMVKYSAHRSMAGIDSISFWLGYLYGFPSLMGILGGISVLISGPSRFYNIKVLFFVPSAVWSTQLVLGNFRWGLTYWTEWLYLVPIMTLCIFVLYCTVKKTHIPCFAIHQKNSRTG